MCIKSQVATFIRVSTLSKGLSTSIRPSTVSKHFREKLVSKNVFKAFRIFIICRLSYDTKSVDYLMKLGKQQLADLPVSFNDVKEALISLAPSEIEVISVDYVKSLNRLELSLKTFMKMKDGKYISDDSITVFINRIKTHPYFFNVKLESAKKSKILIIRDSQNSFIS